MVFPYTRAMHNTDPNAAAAVADPVIEVEGLAKEYRVFDKPEGLAASVRALFHRTSRAVEAVKGVDLVVGRGEFVALRPCDILTTANGGPMVHVVRSIVRARGEGAPIKRATFSRARS